MLSRKGGAGAWKKRFAILPMEITYGPDKGRNVWLQWYYVRWRRVFGAMMIDRARVPGD